MAAEYTPISLNEMKEVLEPLGFTVVQMNGVREVVFGKRVDQEGADPLSLRVFSSIEAGISRECGADAIRVQLASKLKNGAIKIVGKQKRVNRTQGWKDNLLERVNHLEAMMGPVCPCGAHMVERKGKNGFFWGCCRFPDCRETMKIVE